MNGKAREIRQNAVDTGPVSLNLTKIGAKPMAMAPATSAAKFFPLEGAVELLCMGGNEIGGGAGSTQTVRSTPVFPLLSGDLFSTRPA